MEGYFEETGGGPFWEGHSERLGLAHVSGFLWDLTPFCAILRVSARFRAFGFNKLLIPTYFAG